MRMPIFQSNNLDFWVWIMIRMLESKGRNFLRFYDKKGIIRSKYDKNKLYTLSSGSGSKNSKKIFFTADRSFLSRRRSSLCCLSPYLHCALAHWRSTWSSTACAGKNIELALSGTALPTTRSSYTLSSAAGIDQSASMVLPPNFEVRDV